MCVTVSEMSKIFSLPRKTAKWIKDEIRRQLQWVQEEKLVKNRIIVVYLQLISSLTISVGVQWIQVFNQPGSRSDLEAAIRPVFILWSSKSGTIFQSGDIYIKRWSRSSEFSLRSVPGAVISQPQRWRKRSTKPSCSTVLSLRHDSIFLPETACFYRVQRATKP